MEGRENLVRTLGTMRIELLESPLILSLRSMSEPDRELVPSALHATERRWLAAMVNEVVHASERVTDRRRPVHLPNRADLSLPKPRELHPIDHFGRAWNVFTQAVELMGAYAFFCDEAGREVKGDLSSALPRHSLCLRFS